MKSQHTPGPWFVAKLASPAYCTEFGVYAEGAPRDLARVMGENSAADAALIAAVPKLIAALQAAVSEAKPLSVRRELRPGDDCTNLVEITEWPDWLDQAREAIAEATEVTQ